jgi:predicted DNA-binding antitoxin AbrB/MazE fold protein
MAMREQIRAVYENGVFRPLNPVDLAEGDEVRLVVSTINSDAARQELDSLTLPPSVLEESERSRLLIQLVEEMQQHPLIGDPPRLTRDELHERS